MQQLAELGGLVSLMLLSCRDAGGLVPDLQASARLLVAASLLRGPAAGAPAVELLAESAEAAGWSLPACCDKGGPRRQWSCWPRSPRHHAGRCQPATAMGSPDVAAQAMKLAA